MNAVIVVVNPRRGMYAAALNTEEFVIFELLDSEEPEIGDDISCSDFYLMGDTVIRNHTQLSKFDAFIQNICGRHQVKQQCLF